MAPGSLKRPSVDDGTVTPPPVKRKIAATTTNSAVANFFKPASTKEPEKTTFHTVHETLLVARNDNAHNLTRTKPVKIAAFDFDDTLITTKSGLKFARGEDDWKWWHASVPTKLKELHSEGYAIVIISNQAAVALKTDAKSKTLKSDMRSLSNLKGKLSAVFKALDLPMSAYAATEKDGYRKPRTGIWEQLRRDYGLEGESDVDFEGSVFVGDAAGRAADKNHGRKKDHSCSDRDFAANVGIGFSTPEEFFLGEEKQPFTRLFNPAQYLATATTSHSDDAESKTSLFTKRNEKDIVLFCGSPGAGKSTFYWRTMQPLGYERVNQDLLKTRDKCMKVATQAIGEGKSVVVDNTNADIETRGAWIALAKTLKVPVRLVHFTAPAGLCEHNDTVRALTGSLMNPEKRAMLPKMAFAGFLSRYREPTLKEGFQDITKVDFKFEGTEEQRKQWRKYWVS